MLSRAKKRHPASKKHRSRAQKIGAGVGLIVFVAGIGLVIRGEMQRSRDNLRFREAQAVLKQGIDVFSSTTASDRETTTTIAENAEPSTLPAFDGTRAIARIQLPDIGVDVATVKYTRYADLEIGLGWMSDSAAIGDIGTSVIVGHRTLFGAPLLRADEIATGDEIRVVLADGREVTYRVTQTLIRRPSEVFSDLIGSPDQSRLLLVTCHPENSTDFRLLVVADGAATE